MNITPEQLFSAIQEHQRRGFGLQDNPRAASLLGAWNEVLAREASIVESVIERKSAIMRDNNLSRDGREKALKIFAKEAIKDFEWLGEKVTSAQQARNRWKALCINYMDRQKGRSEEVAEHRAIEIRRYYSDKHTNQRNIAFLQAAEKLDRETMRALQDAPGGPWISGEMLERSERLYAERENPKAFAQWQEIGVLIEHLEGIANHTAQVLLTLTMGEERSAILKTLGLTDTVQERSAHA